MKDCENNTAGDVREWFCKVHAIITTVRFGLGAFHPVRICADWKTSRTSSVQKFAGRSICNELLLYFSLLGPREDPTGTAHKSNTGLSGLEKGQQMRMWAVALQ